MNRRLENDPLCVAMIGAQLYGRTCQDWSEAFSEARNVLRHATRLIAREMEEEEFQAELAADPISERVFIDWMVKDVCKDQRFTRRKAFFERMWPLLRASYPAAPNFNDHSLFSIATLQGYQRSFALISSKHLKAVRRANAQKPRSEKFLQKSLASQTPSKRCKSALNPNEVDRSRGNGASKCADLLSDLAATP